MEELSHKNTGKETEILETSMCEIVNHLAKILKDRVDPDGKKGLDELESGLTPILTEIRKRTTEVVISSKDPKELTCHCGEKMSHKENCRLKIVGLANYDLYRRSYHCKVCKQYEKPLDGILKIKGHYSLEVKKAMVLLGQELPFEQSSEYLEKLIHVQVSHQSIQSLVEDVGERISEGEAKLVRESIDENGHIKEWEETKTRSGTAYLMLDGCMVSTREEAYKEVRNGILFEDSKRIQIDAHHKRIIQKRYFSQFNSDSNSLRLFLNRATQEAYDFQFHRYEQSVILADGANWIWDYADTYHPNAIQILDFYHASQYLHDAIHSLDISDSQLKTQLFDYLKQGNISAILDFLNSQSQTDSVQNCLRYYQKNSHRMRYQYFKDLGLDIGSGPIESAHRTIVQSRMKQAGMHWAKRNVQSIVSLRSKLLSGHWNSVVSDYLLIA